MVFLNTIKYILAFKRSAASQRCGAAWGRSVTVDPQDRGQIYITTFGGSVWHGKAQ